MKRRERWLVVLSIAVLLLVTLLGGIVNALAGDGEAAEPVQETTAGETGDGTALLPQEAPAEPGNGGEVAEQAAPGPQVEEGGGGTESTQGELSPLCWPTPEPEPKGKICVVKFLDLDKDGKKDCGEGGMPGVTIKLNGGNPKTTGSDGTVCYDGLEAGWYTVSEVVPAGYRATTDTSYRVEITKNCYGSYSISCTTPSCSYNTVTVFFGNTPVEPPEPGSISGHKYEDLDGDGVLDAGEPALEGVRIELWQGSTMVDWTTTGADGSYFFGDLDPGTYTVKEILTSEWVATNPADGSHDDIAVAEGQDITDLDFLNRLHEPVVCNDGIIEARVSVDSNCNGKFDGGDTPLDGVTLRLFHIEHDGGLTPVTPPSQITGPGWGWEVLFYIIKIPVNYTGGHVIWENLPRAYAGDQFAWYKLQLVVPEGYDAVGDTEYDLPLRNCPLPCYWYRRDFLLQGRFHISGHKYEDLDGDGVNDPGEPALEGVRIELWQGSTMVDWTTTGTDGSYLFDDLPHGVYTVKEVLDPGWSPTNPADGVHEDVAVGCGDNVENLDFLNQREHCSISGHKFEDLDGDGVKDAGEPALEGVRIELWQGSTMVDWTTTGAGGFYSFTDLPPGTYDVKEVLDPGWFPTNPADGAQEGIVVSGDDVENIDFLNCEYGSISGHKYEDLDGDGVKDAGEPALEGVRIELWQGSTMVDWTTTGAGGFYSFTDLPPGTYDVKEVLDPGWFPTNPADGAQEGIVVSGDDVENIDFLNCEYASIRGIKFLDLDGDGIMDPTEEGLDGVTITLDPGGLSTVTAGGGQFSFENLVPGDYTVSVDESSVPGYYPTTPTSLPVGLESGETETVSFGNSPYGSISGHKWLDADLDGVWDAGETVTIPGVTIKLYEGDSPLGDPIATMDTGLDGSYAFPNLEAGTYTLVEEAEEGYFPTTPTTFVVELSPGEGEERDFGNCPYSRIDGLKFEDLDGDGVRDEGEEGLKDVEITLTGPDDLTVTAYSGEDGTFAFEDLIPGDYTVSEKVPTGYYATGPVSVDITLEPGDEASVIFSNAPYGSISGTKWLDVNRNGAIDDADTPLAGVTIKLEGETLGGELVSFTQTTADDGTYAFPLLEAGDYTVSEEFDTTKYYNVFETSMDVELAPGEDRDDIDFLNADVPVGGEVVTPPKPPAVTAGTTALPATGMEQLPLLLLAAGFVLAGLVLLALGLRRRYGRQAV
ncbi:MAG: carboxypeptidase regulatory-like domain-containing protein [Actinobacteria bacterium]|nr:carboxypeptidase regulatory-like domain-containing protein [Actinomycetota bacterium]